jgi:MazG family protein
MSPTKFERLIEIMARLRGPGGCPWDREQTFESLRPYLIEEAYEVIEAIERKDWAHLPEELGDLQLQIVFQSQIAAEAGLFTIDNVLESINAKLIRRHPHVFGSESLESAGEVVHRWEEIKAAEKESRASAKPGSDSESRLESVGRAQPALLEAEQLAKNAAKAGFRWDEFEPMAAKLIEEIGEIEEARAGGDANRVEEEVGDLLFSVINIARHLKINPELALRRSNAKFRSRFAHVEKGLRERGKSFETSDVGELIELWQAAKEE